MSIKSIVEDIKKLTAIELSELVKEIEETFGVSAAAPVAAVAAPAAGGDAGASSAAEKTEFKVTLKDAGAKKIGVIKALKSSVAGLGLKEAKDMVDSAPAVIKEGVNKEEAESMKKALEEAGATVELS